MYKEASICLTEAIYHIEDDITCLNNLGLALIKLENFKKKNVLTKPKYHQNYLKFLTITL